jgi:hypothetical protein
MLSFWLGDLLAKWYKGKSDTLRGLLLGVPFALVCIIIIVLGWQ